MVSTQKTEKVTPAVRNQRKRLGEKIKTLREKESYSLRQFADLIGIPASNLMYLEEGRNAPTPHVYGEIIKHLRPGKRDRENMDKLYSALRGSPPPDVCEIVTRNKGLNDALRILDGVTLTDDQLKVLKKTLQCFRPPDRGGGACEKHE